MRILLVNSLYPPDLRGGAERSVAELEEELTALGLDVSVLALDVSGHGSQESITRLPVPSRHPWSPEGRNALSKSLWHLRDRRNPRQARKIARLLRAVKPDIVHTHNLAGIGVDTWRVAAAAGVPVIHTLRDHYLMCVRSVMCRGDSRCEDACASCRLYTRPRRVASNRYLQGMIGVSQYVLDRHVHAGYGIAAPLHRVIANAPLMGMPADVNVEGIVGRTVGYLGALTPVKGAHVLVPAFRNAAPQDARLLLAGAGDAAYMARLRTLANGDDRIEFIGEVPAPSLLSRVGAVVVPSICDETYGRVVAEASLWNRIVLFSEVGALRETAQAVRAHGIATETSSVASWESALTRYFAGSWDEFGGSSRPAVSCASAHLSYYEEIMRAWRRREPLSQF